MFKFHSTALALFYLFSGPIWYSDIVARDTIPTAVANGVTYRLTSDFLSATPSVSLGVAGEAYSISSITLLTARTNDSEPYDNFRFGFGQATDVDAFRTEQFGSAFFAGQLYPHVSQATGLLSPTSITPRTIGGHNVEELLFDGLQIQVPAGSEFHLITFSHRVVTGPDSVGLLFSSGTAWDDRFDNATTSGGLILNPDFPLDESEFAIRVEGKSVPEPGGLSPNRPGSCTQH